MKSTLKPFEIMILGLAVVAFVAGVVITVWSSRDAKRGADVYSKLVAPAGSASPADAKKKATGLSEGESRSRREGPRQGAPNPSTPAPQMKSVRRESPFSGAAVVGNGAGALSGAGNAPKTASIPAVSSDGSAVEPGAVRSIDLSTVMAGRGSDGNVITITGPDGSPIEATIITTPLDGSTIQWSVDSDGNAKSGAAVKVEIKKE